MELFESVSDGPYRGKTELQRERPDLVGKAIALRTREHTYVYRLYEDDELYDRQADPCETTNLIHTEAAGPIARTLRDQVLAWLWQGRNGVQASPANRLPLDSGAFRFRVAGA